MTNKPLPRITPYLLYEDVANAAEWLATAFNFRVVHQQVGADGKVGHCAMEIAPGVEVMMGCPGPAYRNPKHLGHVTQHLYVNIDDVDAHFERARHAGACIIETPTDQRYGERRYAVTDPEGFTWFFAQVIK